MKSDNIRNYTLMHKNVPVVDIGIYSDDIRSNIENIGAVHNPKHLPVGTLDLRKKEATPNRSHLDLWLFRRRIPDSRDGLDEALERLGEYGVHSTFTLVEKSLGISLSDQYWLRPESADLIWEKVDFFRNDFSGDIGEILLGNYPKNKEEISLISPDNPSDGWLSKKWVIQNGKRLLMKGGSGAFQQEPFNEVVASAIMKRLEISHIPYTLTFDSERKPYSLCENFVTPTTELIPAYLVTKAAKKSNNDSHYTHLLKCCEKLEIPNVKQAIDKMLTLDYIIFNEDRHYYNFGFIRNAETLKWEGFSPIFDSGTSLWYNTPFVGEKVSCKPFYAKHEKQLTLVDDLSWFDSDALVGLEHEIKEIFKPSRRVDDYRAEMIAKYTMENVKKLKIS
jgi:hypothetical protein